MRAFKLVLLYVLIFLASPVLYLTGLCRKPARYGIVGNPQEWLGHQLILRPFYGWGWISANGPVDCATTTRIYLARISGSEWKHRWWLLKNYFNKPHLQRALDQLLAQAYARCLVGG